MHQSIRRGLLGTLFAGGLLALGSTAASAADTTSGSDGLLSGTQVNAPVTAPITLGTTSIGVVGEATAVAVNRPAVNPPAVNQPAGAPGSGVMASGSSMVPAGASRATVLASTGASTDLLWFAVLFVGAGLIMMGGGLRKKA